VLHDLVQLDLNTVGILTRIEHDTAQVIDQNDQVKTVKAQGIRKKIDSRRAVGRDADGNGVGAGDTVLVLKGTYEGEKGTVKHIYRASLFLLVRSRTQKRNHRYVYQYVAYKEIQEIVITENHNLFRGSQDPFTDNEKDVMTSYFTKTYLSLEDHGRAI